MKKIKKMYAWIATEKDGGEGICAGPTEQLGMLPLVGAERKTVDAMKPIAVAVGEMFKTPVKLVQFDNVTVLEEIDSV